MSNYSTETAVFTTAINEDYSRSQIALHTYIRIQFNGDDILCAI